MWNPPHPGLIAGINAARLAVGKEPVVFPPETAMGSLAQYITTADPKHFQPMNANFGLFPPLPKRIRSREERNRQFAERALNNIQDFSRELTVCLANQIDRCAKMKAATASKYDV